MIGLLVPALVALVAPAHAAQVALDLDATEVREGQTVGLSLTVVDTAARGVPTVPVPEGLEVEFRSQSQERTIINFQATVTTTYRYALTATRKGAYVVGPVTVQTSAGPLQTQALPVRVEARADGEGADAVVASVSTEATWVGQVVVYHLRFQTDRPMVNGKWTPPRADGLTTEPSVEPSTVEYEVVEGGKGFSVEELFYPLRATAPGKWTLAGGLLTAEFAVPRAAGRGPRGFDPVFPGMGPFTQVQREVFAADPVAVDVKPLPSEGRPADFSGLVGSFRIEAKPSATEVGVGDTVTVEVRVDGDGPLAGFTLPPLQGEGFRVYDDQPVVEAKLTEGRFAASATFKRAVVPQAPGELTLPPISLSWFDVATGRYAIAATEPIVLNVTGEAGTAQLKSYDAGGPREVSALGEDILPVRTDVAISRPLSARWAWALLVPGAAALAWQGSQALRRRPRAPTADRPLDFEDLPGDRETRLAGLERILRERAGARLGMSPDAVRREDLGRLGAAAGPAEDAWRKLEAARYGAGGALPEAEVRAAVESL